MSCDLVNFESFCLLFFSRFIGFRVWLTAAKTQSLVKFRMLLKAQQIWLQARCIKHIWDVSDVMCVRNPGYYKSVLYYHATSLVQVRIPLVGEWREKRPGKNRGGAQWGEKATNESCEPFKSCRPSIPILLYWDNRRLCYEASAGCLSVENVKNDHGFLSVDLASRIFPLAVFRSAPYLTNSLTRLQPSRSSNVNWNYIYYK